MPPRLLDAVEIVDLLVEIGECGQIGDRGAERQIAFGDGSRAAPIALGEEPALVREQPPQALTDDDIDIEEPRLADDLPFLPQQIGCDLAGGVGGAAPGGPQRDQRLDVLSEADRPPRRRAGAAENRGELSAQRRVGQEAGLQDLRLGQPSRGTGGSEVGVVLDGEQADGGDAERTRGVERRSSPSGRCRAEIEVGHALGEFGPRIERGRRVGLAPAQQQHARLSAASLVRAMIGDRKLPRAHPILAEIGPTFPADWEFVT